MGTRISLGKGFTIGRSGLRWGHSIPGVPQGYASVGRSGTLLTGAHLRHWEPAQRHPVGGTTRCQGLLRSGTQCTNRATLGLTCRVHQDQGPPESAVTTRRRLTTGQWVLYLMVAALILAAFIKGYLDQEASCIPGATCANGGYVR